MISKKALNHRLKQYDPKTGQLHFLLAEATPAFWDEQWQAQSMAQAVATKSTMAGRMVSHFLRPADGPILEAGCGPGHQLAALAYRGYQTVGLDLAAKTLAALHGQRPTWSLALAEVNQLPFPAGSFAAALLLGVIEHFPAGYTHTLQEMRRVIRPGGYLFLTAPFLSPLRRFKANRHFYPIVSHSDPRFYQYALPLPPLLGHLQQAGFQLRRQLAYNPVQGLWEEVAWLQFLAAWQRRRWLNRLLQAGLTPVARWIGHTIFLVLERK